MRETIEMGNEEIIEFVSEKLSLADPNDALLSILHRVKKKDYSSALREIESYMSQEAVEQEVVVQKAREEDSETQALQEEFKRLEKQFTLLREEKSETLNLISDFNTRYSLQLGDLIRKVLSLKRGVPYRQVVDKVKEFNEIKEIYQNTKDAYEQLKSQKDFLEGELDTTDEFDDAYDEIYEKIIETKEKLHQVDDRLQGLRKKIKESKDNIKSDPAHQEYQETTKEYQEFKEEQEELISDEKRFEITEEEKKELKVLFRRAVKLCHPDIVAEKFKEQAQAMIQDLNRAYKRDDIAKVTQILDTLENSIKFKLDSETIDDQDILRFKITDISNKIKEISIDINDIKSDETYMTISHIDDWDEYFTEIHTTLLEEYKRLKEELLRGF